MKAHIKKLTPFGYRYEERELNAKEMYQLRKETGASIRDWFKFEDYADGYNHLLYYAELNGEAWIYTNGWIMNEQEFDELVAMREGIGFVGAFHRGTYLANA